MPKDSVPFREMSEPRDTRSQIGKLIHRIVPLFPMFKVVHSEHYKVPNALPEGQQNWTDSGSDDSLPALSEELLSGEENAA